MPGIAEVGDGCGDPACGCALERIDHDHQFHQIVVRRRAGGLQNEDVFAAYVFLDFNLDFAVGETAHHCFTEGDSKNLDDILSKRRIGVASKNHQAVMAAAHHAPASGWAEECENFWQGRKDSNPRMPESKSGALTNLATPLH
ncbi:protein of unknown function [Paraburkholderia kururiensis]